MTKIYFTVFLFFISFPVFAGDYFFGIGKTYFAHQVSSKQSAVSIGYEGKWEYELTYLGNIDTVPNKVWTEFRGGYRNDHFGYGLTLYHNVESDFDHYAVAPYISTFFSVPGGNINLSYRHSLKEEHTTSHAWLLEYRLALK